MIKVRRGLAVAFAAAVLVAATFAGPTNRDATLIEADDAPGCPSCSQWEGGGPGE